VLLDNQPRCAIGSWRIVAVKDIRIEVDSVRPGHAAAHDVARRLARNRQDFSEL